MVWLKPSVIVGSSFKRSGVSKLIRFLLSFGPGIFAIGYTIGTGSVTSMIVAGNSFGMDLLWVLAFSCLFSGVLIYVSGQYYLSTGETILRAVRQHLPAGQIMAVIIMISVGLGQWNSLIGILGITSNVIFEILQINFPQLTDKYAVVLGIATFIIGIFYLLLLEGSYSLFEKVLALFVSAMGLSFFFTLFFVVPLPMEVVLGLIPRIPQVEGSGILIAAFVGTTMAAATFLSRPLFIQGKGWKINDQATHRNDAIVAAILIFVISGSIMSVAAGSLHGSGAQISKVLDMSGALTPLAGKFAVAVFFIGTLSAGLSSIFPCLMIVPLMIADYSSGRLDVQSKRFRVITGLASVISLSIPVFGVNPIKGQLLSQLLNAFGLPLVILVISLLWNRKGSVSGRKWFTNTVLLGALIFALIISYQGLQDILNAY